MVVVSAFSLIACDKRAAERGVDTGGTLVIATTADPGTLFPPLIITSQAKQIAEQIYDYLADVGPDLNTRNETGFRPALADRWRWSNDSLMLAFHINPAAKWHDGRDVTARDIAFTFGLNRNPDFGGRVQSELANIDSVTITDSLTAVFWFHRRSPSQFLDAAAQMLILPAHQLENLRLQALRENPPPAIGTGRFRLRRWNSGESVEIVADTTNYRGRARLDRVIWSVTPDFQTAVTRLFGGEADLVDLLRPEDLVHLKERPNLRAVTLPGMDYAFLRFNLRDRANSKRPHQLFGDRELRRALALALDRASMARNILDTFAFVPVGPNVRAFPSTDPHGAQLPFDSARANALLDSIGWVSRDADGTRMKAGKRLAFPIIMPTSSLNRMKLGPLIQEQLRRIGARVQLEPTDNATMLDLESRGDFDAVLDAWVMPASPDALRNAWTTGGIGRGGTNYGSYSNPRFDALLDSALDAPATSARAAFTRAYEVINGDAPAVWLYEPKRIIGIHRRVRTAAMRPDAWWFALADWYVPRGERIARDQITLER